MSTPSYLGTGMAWRTGLQGGEETESLVGTLTGERLGPPWGHAPEYEKDEQGHGRYSPHVSTVVCSVPTIPPQTLCSASICISTIGVHGSDPAVSDLLPLAALLRLWLWYHQDCR